MRYFGIYLRIISRESLVKYILDSRWKINNLRLQPRLPGAVELICNPSVVAIHGDINEVLRGYVITALRVICDLSPQTASYLLEYPSIDWTLRSVLMFYWHSNFGLHSGNEVVSILSLPITQETYGLLVVHLTTAVLQRRIGGIVTANGLLLLWIIVLFSLYILATYYIRFLFMIYFLYGQVFILHWI